MSHGPFHIYGQCWQEEDDEGETPLAVLVIQSMHSHASTQSNSSYQVKSLRHTRGTIREHVSSPKGKFKK